MSEGGLRATAKAAVSRRHDSGATTDEEEDSTSSSRLLHSSPNRTPHPDPSKNHRPSAGSSRQQSVHTVAVVVLAFSSLSLLILLCLRIVHVPNIGLDSPSDDNSDGMEGGTTEQLRVMVLMGDNRDLRAVADLEELDEVTASTYLNYQYTRLHQPLLSFLYVRYDPLDPSLQPRAARASNSSKHTAACYNQPLQQARAAPWCKIVAAYIALEQYGDVDVVLFIDSDAAVTHQQLSVQRLLRTVDTLPGYCTAEAFLRGAASPCSVLFFKNAPFESTWPNTGAWLVRRSLQSDELLRHWWHFDHSSRNFYHAYEQDTLHMLVHHLDQQRLQGVAEASKVHFGGAAMDQVLGMIDEPSMQHVSSLQFIHHWTSPDRSLRLPFFQRLIRRMQQDTALTALDHNLSRVIRTIQQHHTLHVNLDRDRIPAIGGLHDGAGTPVNMDHWVEVWKGKLRPT